MAAESSIPMRSFEDTDAVQQFSRLNSEAIRLIPDIPNLKARGRAATPTWPVFSVFKPVPGLSPCTVTRRSTIQRLQAPKTTQGGTGKPRPIAT